MAEAVEAAGALAALGGQLVGPAQLAGDLLVADDRGAHPGGHLEDVLDGGVADVRAQAGQGALVDVRSELPGQLADALAQPPGPEGVVRVADQLEAVARGQQDGPGDIGLPGHEDAGQPLAVGQGGQRRQRGGPVIHTDDLDAHAGIVGPAGTRT